MTVCHALRKGRDDDADRFHGTGQSRCQCEGHRQAVRHADHDVPDGFRSGEVLLDVACLRHGCLLVCKVRLTGMEYPISMSKKGLKPAGKVGDDPAEKEVAMIPLHHESHFTFRFGDDRIIPRFHLEGVEAGRRISVIKIEANTGERLGLLTSATVGEAGWVSLTEPILVRAGDAFIAVLEDKPK